MPDGFGRRRGAGFSIAAALTIALVAVEIAVLIIYRETWVDEFFSAFKGYLVLTGELVPYRNGIFDYPPLVIPTYGLVHYLFGPNFYAARILSAVFFSAMAVFLFLTGRRLGGRWAGLGAVALVASNLLVVGNFVSATMYALAGFLLVLVVWVEASVLSERKKTILASVLLALAFLARTNMIVAFLAYVGWLVLMRVSPRRIASAVGVWSVVAALGYLSIFWFNPALAFAHFFIVFGSVGPLAWLPPSLKVGGAGIGMFLEVFAKTVKEYYGFLLLFSVSAALVLWERRTSVLVFLRAERAYALALILSAAFFITHYGYPRIVGNVGYATYFIALMALVSTTAMARFLGPRRVWAALFAGVAILNLSANLYRTDVISHPGDESDFSRVERGAALLRAHTEKNDRILTFDNSLVHVFLADRRTFFPLMSRDFLYIANADTEKVRASGYYNLEMLKSWALTDADFLALHKEKWNESFIRRPFFGAGNEETQKQFAEIRSIFSRNYELVASAFNVYPRKYTEGNDGGTLELYRRIPR